MKAEGEVWAWERGHGLDEDVCDGLVAGEVWVELIARGLVSLRTRPRHIESR